VILVAWKKQVGDAVAVNDILCEVETDKATMEVEAPAAGTLLAQLYQPGDDVPVMVAIAFIGAAGETYGDTPAPTAHALTGTPAPEAAPSSPNPPILQSSPLTHSPTHPLTHSPVSPRARHLAERRLLDTVGLAGSGPDGRIIERDVLAALASQPKLSPVAKAMVSEGNFTAPAQGSGPGGRVMSRDLSPAGAMPVIPQPAATAPGAPAPSVQHPAGSDAPIGAGEVEVIPLKGVRKVIAERMLASVQSTAQLTLHASADARAVQNFRARLKASPAEMGLTGITINDLLLLAVARTLPQFPAINALFTGDAVHQHRNVHLGIAVDTPKGLLVPVIRHAEQLTLKALSAEAKRLANAAIEGKAKVDELNGGTFTVTNLGSFGIEQFTPVLNLPQVAILGVGNITLKPVQGSSGVEFVPSLGLSLTINHQVVDGAPAARFLHALSQALAAVDLLVVG
jgi:pyruvate dehydrogenase E2 component (dihydrolipoamide acetyltransferase)